MTNQLPSSRQDLAAAINLEHRAFTKSAVEALEHARRCGELLIEAKSRCTHGQWLPWLKANCNVSPRQSQRYIQVAKNWHAIQAKNDATSHLTIDGAIRTLVVRSNEDLVAILRELETRTILTAEDAFAWHDEISSIESYWWLHAYHRQVDRVDAMAWIEGTTISEIQSAGRKAMRWLAQTQSSLCRLADDVERWTKMPEITGLSDHEAIAAVKGWGQENMPVNPAGMLYLINGHAVDPRKFQPTG